jgi:hypothetical protein
LMSGWIQAEYLVTEDPDCVRILAGEPGLRPVKQKLREEMEAALRREGDPRVLGHRGSSARTSTWARGPTRTTPGCDTSSERGRTRPACNAPSSRWPPSSARTCPTWPARPVKSEFGFQCFLFDMRDLEETG